MIELIFKVCSDYDVKEKIFRNFGCVLGPYSKLIALHQWNTYSNLDFIVQFVWIDPFNTIVYSSHMKIQSNNTDKSTTLISTNKPNLNFPLKSGKWKLMIHKNNKVLAETSFLIVPFLFVNGTRIADDQQINLSDDIFRQENQNNFFNENALIDKTSKKLKMTKKHEKKQFDWVQNMSLQFWKVEGICSIDDISDFNCNQTSISLCNSMRWSSYYPDPKSEL